ncbi:MAG: hypothetical protein WCF92_02755 [bacterium]
MDDEIENLLRETRDLAEENNKILKGIRRSNRWGAFIKVFYWIIFIALTIGAFAYIQPYLDSMLKLYNQVEGANNQITASQGTISGGIKDYFMGTGTGVKK